jgi:hypothetical protein
MILQNQTKTSHSPKKMFKDFLENFSAFVEGFKNQSTSAIELQLHEMENGFGLIAFGSLMGMPSPPNYLGMALLPYIEHEIKVMIFKSERLDDRLAEFFDLSDI